MELVPKGGVNFYHHTAISEHFEAVEGILGIHCGGKELLLTPSQLAEVPRVPSISFTILPIP